MKSELIVDVQPQEVSIALLEEGRLVSLQKEARNIAYAVGDIYLAKVKKLMPGLNAAFVNVGYEKDAFLHYLDLGPHFATYLSFLHQLLGDRQKVPQVPALKLLPDIDKHGTVAEALSPGQELLVQIVKEPISSKGPRLTTEITLTGRYLVLTPFCDKISISQKIKNNEEKLRLRALIASIKPRNFGVIVRTSAEGKRAADLNAELLTLLQNFHDLCAKAQKATAPALVFEEESRTVGMLRDIFTPEFESIHVNDPDVYGQIRSYVSLIAPERADVVKLYQKPEPIFDHFSITRQIKSSFGKTVSFKNGAYIIIEHTEALHVIDVNSGNRSKAGSDQETNALEVNLRAAEEIVRQLRLRDMGGIIVVDFIDMGRPEHRQQLFEHMRELMAKDRARHNILPLSKFGLMQITRQRVRPALDITVEEECPSCFGKGTVQPSLLFTDTLREKLEYITGTLKLRDFTVYVHPFVDAYIKKGFIFTLYRSWRREIGGGFRILPDESLPYLHYRVVDSDGNELQLQDEKDSGKSSAAKKGTKALTRGQDETPEPDSAETLSNEQPREQAPKAPNKKKAKAKKEKADKPQTPKPAPKAFPLPDSVKPDQPEKEPEPAPKANKKPKVKKPKTDAPKSAAPEPDAQAAETQVPVAAGQPETLQMPKEAEEPAVTDAPAPAPKAKAKRNRKKKAAPMEQLPGLEDAPVNDSTEGTEQTGTPVAEATDENSAEAPAKPKTAKKRKAPKKAALPAETQPGNLQSADSAAETPETMEDTAGDQNGEVKPRRRRRHHRKGTASEAEINPQENAPENHDNHGVSAGDTSTPAAMAANND